VVRDGFEATVKSYAQSSWQPTSSAEFCSTYLLIKGILSGDPERGSSGGSSAYTLFWCLRKQPCIFE